MSTRVARLVECAKGAKLPSTAAPERAKSGKQALVWWSTKPGKQARAGWSTRLCSDANQLSPDPHVHTVAGSALQAEGAQSGQYLPAYPTTHPHVYTVAGSAMQAGHIQSGQLLPTQGAECRREQPR
eukprot:364746-Chlamydomonas_euryale.AAC.11